MVYRDFCPLDSLIQSAGRCNRHDEASGIVHFVRLCAQNKVYAEFIYEPVKLDLTQKRMTKWEKWEEAELFSLLDEYFNQVSDRSKNDSVPILQGVKQLYFSGEKQHDRCR